MLEASRIADLDWDGAVAWVTPSVAGRVHAALPEVPQVDPNAPLSAPVLLVCGGGALIDRGKAATRRGAVRRRLIAIPSLWGSGAEVSPVMALNAAEGKRIEVAPDLVPDARATWPELAETVPASLALDACADAWAHALEAFVSPLATDSQRSTTAELVRELLDLPLGRDSRWFEASARACDAQAQSGVGLVHGIAHTLEGPTGLGHAALVATFVAPVFELMRARFVERCAAYGLDHELIFERLRGLHRPERHVAVADALRAHWPRVLRDPCTRTHAVRVRRDDLERLAA